METPAHLAARARAHPVASLHRLPDPPAVVLYADRARELLEAMRRGFEALGAAAEAQRQAMLQLQAILEILQPGATETPEDAAEPVAPEPVVDLMAALEQSLARAKERQRTSGVDPD